MHAPRTLAVFAGAILVVTLLIFARRDSFRISYHMWRLKSASAENMRVYRSEETLRDKWMAQFCQILHIKRASPGIRQAEEIRLLLEMGYMQKLELRLTNSINFGVLATNAMREFSGEWWQLGSNPSQTVATVIAPTNRLAQWENLICTAQASK